MKAMYIFSRKCRAGGGNLCWIGRECCGCSSGFKQFPDRLQCRSVDCWIQQCLDCLEQFLSLIVGLHLFDHTPENRVPGVVCKRFEGNEAGRKICVIDENLNHADKIFSDIALVGFNSGAPPKIDASTERNGLLLWEKRYEQKGSLETIIVAG